MSVIYGNMVGGSAGSSVTIDASLSVSGQAADAKAVGDAINQLSEEIATITLGKHTDGLVYVFINGKPIGNGLNLSDTSGGQDEESLPVFANVTWDNTAYAIGNNHEYAYNAWAPNCAHYDSVTKKVMFLQCHRTSHTGTFGASELIAIDPYNVMEYEVIKTFDPINSAVPLCFAIYNGIYYIMSKNTVYTSEDHGKTWTETTIPTALPTAYGLSIIDGVWYVGNDSGTDETDGVYYTSHDNGVNWETKTLDLSDYAGELKCSEASFIKWNGNIFASLRRENANGLLIRQNEDGTWKVLTDSLPNVSSDCALSVTEDRLCYAAINRPSVQIEIGTITISAEDTVSIEPFFTKSFAEVSASGDFHTPSYVYGPDFQMVTFMTNAVQAKEYNGAVNACIVGYADGVEAVGYDYDVITGHLGSNWSTEPYVGAAPDLSAGVATTVDGAVINYNGTVPTYYPSVNGDIVTFNAAANSACKTGILNNVGQAFIMPIMHALQNENGDWIACLSKKKDGTGAASLRFVAKTYKHTILSQPEIQGGLAFDCAVYKATAGSINTAYLSYPIPANLTKRLSVSG